jgi:hypothetical protein
MDVDNYRFQVLEPLAEALGVPKLNFQVMRRTMAMQAQKMESVKDIHAHLRHLRPDTTAKEYMQEQRIGGHSRIRTYDFHRVKVALYR